MEDPSAQWKIERNSAVNKIWTQDQSLNFPSLYHPADSLSVHRPQQPQHTLRASTGEPELVYHEGGDDGVPECVLHYVLSLQQRKQLYK